MENRIAITETHNGRTAAEILRTAEAAPSSAGLPEVWDDDGSILIATEDGKLVIADFDGTAAMLDMTAEDAATMHYLESARRGDKPVKWRYKVGA